MQVRKVLAVVTAVIAAMVGAAAPASADDIIPGDAKVKITNWNVVDVQGLPLITGHQQSWLSGRGVDVDWVGGTWASAAPICHAHLQIKWHHISESNDPTGYEWNQEATTGCVNSGDFKIGFPGDTDFTGKICVSLWRSYWDERVTNTCFDVHP